MLGAIGWVKPIYGVNVILKIESYVESLSE